MNTPLSKSYLSYDLCENKIDSFHWGRETLNNRWPRAPPAGIFLATSIRSWPPSTFGQLSEIRPHLWLPMFLFLLPGLVVSRWRMKGGVAWHVGWLTIKLGNAWKVPNKCPPFCERYPHMVILGIFLSPRFLRWGMKFLILLLEQ